MTWVWRPVTEETALQAFIRFVNERMRLLTNELKQLFTVEVWAVPGMSRYMASARDTSRYSGYFAGSGDSVGTALKSLQEHIQAAWHANARRERERSDSR